MLTKLKTDIFKINSHENIGGEIKLFSYKRFIQLC